jgi:3-hydroxyacyl-CoA dehydrogenase
VNQIIDQYVNENTIIATGTSGLSINSLAESLHKRTRKNYIGLHFYNPPYSMTLCEVIPTKYTEKDHLDDIKKYLRFSLYRTVVEVIDSPAFLGNRIGFQFINEALQYANKYKDNGGIDYIDSILGQFSGRSMPPLKTSDFVGLDVHKAIVDNIYAHTGDYARNTFVLPKFAENLILENKLGLKSGSGLYKTVISESNLKKVYVYDINTNEYRDCVSYNFSFSRDIISALKNGDYDKAFKILVINHSNEAEICLTFLLKYVLYSLTLTNLIGDRIESADDVMATGFNWAPPLSVIDALGGKEKFYFLVNERLDSKLIQNIDLISLLKAIPNKSSYDYRRYFKAR